MKEVRLHHIEGQALSLPLSRHHQLLQVQELLQQVLIGPLVDHEPAEQVVAREGTGKGHVVRRRRDRSSPSPRDRRERERETRVPEPALPPRSERTASSWRPSLAAARGTSAQPSNPLGLQPAVRPRGPISVHLPTEPRLVRRPPQSPQPAGREDLDKPPLQRRSKGEGKKGKSKDSSEKSPLEPKTKPKKKNRGLKRQEWWQQRCAARGRGRGARAAVTTGQEQSEEEAEQATEQEVPDQSPTAEAAEKEASGEDTGAEAAFALEERAARWADAS